MKVATIIKRFHATLFDYGVYFLLTVMITNMFSGEKMFLPSAEVVTNTYTEFREQLMLILEGNLSFSELTINSTSFVTYTLFELTVQIIIGFLLFMLFPIIFRGQTPGQRLIGVIIVRSEKPLRMNELVIRSLFDRWMIISLSLVLSLILTDIVSYLILQSFIYTLYAIYILANAIVIIISSKSIFDYIFNTKMLIIKSYIKNRKV